MEGLEPRRFCHKFQMLDMEPQDLMFVLCFALVWHILPCHYVFDSCGSFFYCLGAHS